MHQLRFSPEFEHEHDLLESKVKAGNGEANYLFGIMEKGLAKLTFNPQAGKHIPKRLIPREYIIRYGVTNLWKLNLDSYWRLIYTLSGDRVNVYSIVLEVLDHKSYNRKFGYHT
jgi:hypothetical protein